MPNFKCYKLILLIIIISAVLLVIKESVNIDRTANNTDFGKYLQIQTLEIDYNQNQVSASTEVSPKVILLWTPFFGRPDYGFMSYESLNCGTRPCVVTNNRSLLQQSEAVMFHAHDTRLNDLPQPRSRNQHYIFVYFEASGDWDLEIFKTPPSYFNWTMTYRRDSDIPRYYGEILNQSSITENMNNIIRGKSKVVAWFASNCNSRSKREDYIRSLSQHVPVDVYGRCGNFSCSERGNVCDSMLRRDYKFYLAFENSICKDYVTEKFFRALEYDIVPVVHGGADYKNVAPFHSYIDTADFKSPKELAEYLKLLDSNDNLYAKYFEWKNKFRANQVKTRAWCDLCAKLHDPALPYTSYENIRTWYADPKQCNNPL